MNVSRYFDNAVMACYDRRAGQWETVEAELAKIGVHPRRFVMGDGSGPFVYDHVDRHKGSLPGRQRLNYAEALLGLVRSQLDSGAEHLLLVEDDVRTHAQTASTLEAVLEQTQGLDFDLFYLHAVRVHSLSRHHAPNVLELDSAHGLRAVVMKREAMTRLSSLTPSTACGIDGMFRDRKQKGLRIYSAWPCLLRADLGSFSYQHDMVVKPEWLDHCVMEKGKPW